MKKEKELFSVAGFTMNAFINIVNGRSSHGVSADKEWAIQERMEACREMIMKKRQQVFFLTEIATILFSI